MLLPRLYLGMIFAIAAYTKIVVPGGFAATLAGFLNGVAVRQGFDWYQHFVSAVVVPHVAVFAVLVIAGEVLVAAAMLTGLALRPASLVAIFLLLNYASAKGLPLWSPASNDAADIVLAILVFAGSTLRRR